MHKIFQNCVIFEVKWQNTLPRLSFSVKNEESCKQKSIAEMKKVPQNLHS